MFTGYIGERRYQHELGLPVLLTLGYHQSKTLLTINKSLLSIRNLTNTRQFFFLLNRAWSTSSIQVFATMAT